MVLLLLLLLELLLLLLLELLELLELLLLLLVVELLLLLELLEISSYCVSVCTFALVKQANGQSYTVAQMNKIICIYMYIFYPLPFPIYVSSSYYILL